MWPSKEAVAYMVNRLEKHRFAFRVDVLEYEKASHILVPLNPSKPVSYTHLDVYKRQILDSLIT